jgi:hypothetical protein
LPRHQDSLLHIYSSRTHHPSYLSFIPRTGPTHIFYPLPSPPATAHPLSLLALSPAGPPFSQSPAEAADKKLASVEALSLSHRGGRIQSWPRANWTAMASPRRARPRSSARRQASASAERRSVAKQVLRVLPG